MAKNYCLPSALVRSFLSGIHNGDLDVFNLQNLSSADRHAKIAQYIGDDHASEVNALFEQKLLLKYKFGLFDWVKQVTTDLSDSQRKTILDKINNLDERILNPKDQQSFLQDLASEKVGARVSMEQAQQIFDLSQRAESLKAEWLQNLDQNISRHDTENPIVLQRIRYGNALLDLKDYIESLKPDGSTFVHRTLNLLSVPKTVSTGLLHFSALGVQAWGMISKRVTWEAFGQQFRYFYDEQNYRDLQAYIISHPRYIFAQKGHLGLTDVSGDLNLREEALQSNFLQNLNEQLADKTGLPINVLGASSRAFTGFLNYTRFNRFVDLIEAADRSREARGLDKLTTDDKVVSDIASVVNNFTGRSNLGPRDSLANNQAWLNATFFAPRKLGATFQMFSPIEYTRLALNAKKTGDWTAFKAATSQLTGSIMATGALLYLANSMGYKVDYNPASTDFLKIETPNGEKIDVTGGNAIYLRLWGRIFLNKTINQYGEKTLGEGYKPLTRRDMIVQFIQNKLAPVAGAIADWTAQTERNPFDPEAELKDKFQPIVMENLMNYYSNQPDKAMSDLPVLASIFGYNTESPYPPHMKFGMNPWGTDDPHFQELDKQVGKSGYVQQFPPNTINGVKLEDNQYQEYIQRTGRLAAMKMTARMSAPDWGEKSQTQQLRALKGLNREAQKMAASKVMLHSIHSDNNILQKSLDNAKAKLK